MPAGITSRHDEPMRKIITGEYGRDWGRQQMHAEQTHRSAVRAARRTGFGMTRTATLRTQVRAGGKEGQTGVPRAMVGGGVDAARAHGCRIRLFRVFCRFHHRPPFFPFLALQKTPPSDKPMWKISKFEQVAPRTQSFR